jgi:hypothetical protein
MIYLSEAKFTTSACSLLTSDVGGREFNPEEADEGGDDLIQ